MDIKELHKVYLNLKDEGLSCSDMEIPFYKALIGYRDNNGNIDFRKITSQIRQDYLIDELSNQYDISCGDEFLVFKSTRLRKNYYIKYYFSVDVEQKEDFILKFADFIIKNHITIAIKVRLTSYATDDVNIRVYDTKDYERVFEFIKPYILKNSIQSVLMPVIDNIGVIISTDTSYNQYIANLLMLYFESGNDKLDNILKFIDNTDLYGGIRDLHTELYGFKDIISIYNENIKKSFDHNLTLNDITLIIDNLQKNHN